MNTPTVLGAVGFPLALVHDRVWHDPALHDTLPLIACIWLLVDEICSYALLEI